MGAGVTVDAGFVDRGSTWDGSPATVTDWVPVKSESLTSEPSFARSEALGQVSQYAGELVRLVVPGDMLAELDYNYGHKLLEYALGAVSTTTYDTGDVLPFFGLEFDKGVSRWRYASVVVQSMTISGQLNGVIEVTYNLVGYEEDRVATAFPSIRPAASLQERVVFEDMVVRLADTANALAGGDVIGVNGFELTLENNMKVDDSDSASNKRILTPERNGTRSGTLRLDFARHNAALHTGGSHPLNTWRDSHTELTADLVFTGSTGSYTFNLPILHVAEGGDAPVSGPEVIPDSVVLDLDGGVNSDMSGVDQLQIVNA